MITSEKAELAPSIHLIERFSKSGIPICNSKVPDTAARKTKRRREAIAKCYRKRNRCSNCLNSDFKCFLNIQYLDAPRMFLFIKVTMMKLL